MKGSDPAFPFTPNEQMKLPDGTWDQNTDFGEPGMDIRTELAGRAMQSLLPLLITDTGAKRNFLGIVRGKDEYEKAARLVLRYSDALIAELQKGETDAGTKD